MIMEAKISVSEEDKTNTFRSGTTSVNETCHNGMAKMLSTGVVLVVGDVTVMYG